MVECLFLKIALCCGLLFLAEGMNAVEHTDEHPLERWSPVRDPRIFPIFRVRIPADTCTSVIVDYDQGYCDGMVSCLTNLGIPSGLCPNLLGVCCVVKKLCGGHIYTRISYFSNKDYPRTQLAAGTCSVTIVQYYADVVQMRIDFLEFDLTKPTAGTCGVEGLTITGGDPRFVIPRLCGNNKGQHIYVNFPTTGNITLTVTYDGATASLFHLKITQYRAHHSEKAPDGCLQYFKSTSGTVASFNYNGMQQLNNQRYLICVSKTGPASQCAIWTFDDFKIAATPTANGGVCVSDSSDYINIPNGTYGGQKVNSFCDHTTTLVTTTSWYIEVVLNADESQDTGATTPSDGTTGFQLSYKLTVIDACPP